MCKQSAGDTLMGYTMGKQSPGGTHCTEGGTLWANSHNPAAGVFLFLSLSLARPNPTRPTAFSSV
jgi:hypothetical protein